MAPELDHFAENEFAFDVLLVALAQPRAPTESLLYRCVLNAAQRVCDRVDYQPSRHRDRNRRGRIAKSAYTVCGSIVRRRAVGLAPHLARLAHHGGRRPPSSISDKTANPPLTTHPPASAATAFALSLSLSQTTRPLELKKQLSQW